jgi:hypothetical protein
VRTPAFAITALRFRFAAGAIAAAMALIRVQKPAHVEPPGYRRPRGSATGTSLRAVRKRVEYEHLGDLVHGELVALGGAPDCLRRRTVMGIARG